MQQLRHLRSISPLASLLALVSVALLVLKVLVLNALPPLFYGAYELGSLVDAVLTSVVASYIFYVLVVHLPTEQSCDHVRPHIAKHTKQIIANCRQQLAAFANATSQSLDLDNFVPANLTTAFAAINPNAPAPMVVFPGGTTATWLYYFEHYIEKTDANIARALANTQFVEAELVELLTSIEDCDHFSHVRLMGTAMPVRNPNLSVWAPSFIEYCNLCFSLQRYVSRALP